LNDIKRTRDGAKRKQHCTTPTHAAYAAANVLAVEVSK
jgi:hypothetical protein